MGCPVRPWLMENNSADASAALAALRIDGSPLCPASAPPRPCCSPRCSCCCCCSYCTPATRHNNNSDAAPPCLDGCVVAPRDPKLVLPAGAAKGHQGQEEEVKGEGQEVMRVLMLTMEAITAAAWQMYSLGVGQERACISRDEGFSSDLMGNGSITASLPHSIQINSLRGDPMQCSYPSLCDETSFRLPM